MMQDAHRYTYDDMILWVLDAFEKNNNLLLDYQERYLYFLVDEFQDTSRSQNLLLQHLVGYWDIPNLFVVGDPDQSIFSFQDANIENIIQFEKQYADDISTINLVNNYRSTQVILDSANALIQNNQQRTVAPGEDGPLQASNEKLLDIHIDPQIIEYPNSLHEAADIAAQIETLLSNKIPGKEIAVIYRNHAQVETLVHALQTKEIAVNMRKQIDALSLPFIDNLITILTWIQQERLIPFSGEDLLFKILHFNFFKLNPVEAAQLNIKVYEKNIGRKGARATLRSELADLKTEAGDLFTAPNNTAKDISNTLEFLLKQSYNTTVQQLIELVIQRANILRYIMEHVDKPLMLQALTAFFNLVKDITRRNQDTDLEQLLKTISLMKKDGIAVPVYKATSTDNGVNLVTAHGSKGSEYAHVFLLGCASNIWDEEKSGSRYQFKYPDNLIGDKNTADALEESRRLFYVAATRAKTHLVISYSEKDLKGKALTKSKFVTEIQEGMGLSITQKSLADDVVNDYIGAQFIEPQPPKIELVEESFISNILKRYSLSVTHLNNYLSCPLKFYYQNLIKVPAAKSESMTFGSAIHFVLQRMFEKMKAANGTFPGKEEIMEDFTWYMNRNREAFTKEEFLRRMEYGAKIVPAYDDAHIDNWNPKVSIEYNMRNIELEGIPLNGKLDKIEFTGNNINIVDYKTGKHANAKKKLLTPNDKEPNGGDYWRQAVFYKILVDNSPAVTWQVSGVTFDFVEPVNNEYKTEDVTITPADITTVTQQIKTVWSKIQNREFNEGCGKPDCEWCNFVKDNQVYIKPENAEQDEEEYDG